MEELAIPTQSPYSVSATQSIHQVDAAEDRLFGLSSNRRIDALLDECDVLRHDLAYELFRRVWSSCDDTISYADDVLELLHGSIDWMAMDNEPLPHEHWFEVLPNRFRIYRGCSIEKCHGVSWSLDRCVALSFAAGHRGLRNKNPVLMSAMIRKHDVLMSINDRGEREVLVDINDLREIRLVHYPRCMLS